MPDMALRGFVSGVNLFTTCKNEKTFTRLFRLIAYIIRMSELHFNRQQVDQVRLAIQLSAEWHKGYYRKDHATPYLIHPLEVAALLLLLGVYDFKLIVASIIHDTVEDEKDPTRRYRKRKMITREFGSTIRAVVEVATKGREPWKKALYYSLILAEKRNSIAWRVKLLKIADCACNTRTFDVFDQKKRDEKIAVIRGIYPQISASLASDLRKATPKAQTYQSANVQLMDKIQRNLKRYK